MMDANYITEGWYYRESLCLALPWIGLYEMNKLIKCYDGLDSLRLRGTICYMTAGKKGKQPLLTHNRRIWHTSERERRIEREHLKLTYPMDQSCRVPGSWGFRVLSPYGKQEKLISLMLDCWVKNSGHTSEVVNPLAEAPLREERLEISDLFFENFSLSHYATCNYCRAGASNRRNPYV